MKLPVQGKSHVHSLLAFQRARRCFFSSIARDKLYRRISPMGDPNISITPVLDQWVQQGNAVTKPDLQQIIKELRVYKRFKHALEVSHWMSKKMYISLSCNDIATRMNLISRVHGIEQVENYFNQIPENLKRFEVYTGLLNCYANEKDVEKAEATFKKLMDMGVLRTPLVFNILMNLYCQTGKIKKLDALVSEMESKGVPFDQFTYSIWLTAYAFNSDTERIDKILERMESNLEVVLDWNTYGIAADGYLQAGLVDKAMAMLKKLEERITGKTKSIAFDTLLKLYARTGNKNEVCRIWKLYKGRKKVYNKGYISVISTLLMFNDFEAAEKIFKEWESRKLSYDFRVPNLLVDAYCRKSLIRKAESLIGHAIMKGGEPSIDTWYCLASGYLEANQIPKAKEALKKVLLLCPPGWKLRKEALASCLDYLEGKGDRSKAEEFLELLKTENIFSSVYQDKLVEYIKVGKSL